MILGIDTSSNFLSLAVEGEGCSLLSYHEKQDRRHGEVIIPELNKLLAKAGRAPLAITGIVVGLGPGSFTGVRIGVITAIGMAQTLGVPIAGFSSYGTVAAQLSGNSLIIGDARRGKVYAGGYEHQKNGLKCFLQEQLTDIETLAGQLPEGPMILSGPDASFFYDSLKAYKSDLACAGDQQQLPKATVLIELGRPIINHGGMSLDKIQPIYLRRTQAEETIL